MDSWWLVGSEGGLSASLCDGKLVREEKVGRAVAHAVKLSISVVNLSLFDVDSCLIVNIIIANAGEMDG